MRYFRGTLGYGCGYKKVGTPELLGYGNIYLVGDFNDRKSNSRMVFFLGDNTVTWTSQKQNIAAMSSCEADYDGNMSRCLSQPSNRRPNGTIARVV